MQELFGVALSITVIYLYALVLLRISGKRSFNNLTPLDFLIALAIGDMFDNVFWGNSPVSTGLTGFAVLVILHTALTYACWKSPRIDHLINSQPTLLVKNGQFVAEALDHERMNRDDVLAELRLLGEDAIEEVREANLEPNGQVSVLKTKPAQVAQKRDWAALVEGQK